MGARHAPQRDYLCVRALEQHAVQLPPNLLPAAADNPEGFQESADLVALNDALLAATGCQWDGCWPLEHNHEVSANPMQKGLEREAQRLLSSWCEPMANSGALISAPRPLMALKDPRLCRTLPHLIHALGVDWLSFGVAIVRDPAAVIASLGYRDDMPPLKAFALWLRYNLELVHQRALHPAVSQWPLLSVERLVRASWKR